MVNENGDGRSEVGEPEAPSTAGTSSVRERATRGTRRPGRPPRGRGSRNGREVRDPRLLRDDMPDEEEYAAPRASDVPPLNIADLERQGRDQLIVLAESLEVGEAAAMSKPELIFRILQRQAARNGTIYSGGVLAVVDDGFGFLRGDRFVPGPSDVYVSQSQVRRFGLRSGDYVTGQVRQPKDQEKYYGLLRVEAVNGIDPEQAKRRPNFEDLTPIFPNRKLQLETRPDELSQRLVDLFAPVGRGQRALIVSPPKAGKTMLLKSIAHGIGVQKLIDRDDMTDDTRAQVIAQGIRVLRRRELEEYLLRSGGLMHVPPDGRLRGIGGGDGPEQEGGAGERTGWTEEHQGCIATAIRRDSPRYAVAEPRQRPGGVRVAIPGTGAPQDARGIRGTPGGRVRFRLTLDVGDLEARFLH